MIEIKKFIEIMFEYNLNLIKLGDVPFGILETTIMLFIFSKFFNIKSTSKQKIIYILLITVLHMLSVILPQTIRNFIDVIHFPTIIIIALFPIITSSILKVSNLKALIISLFVLLLGVFCANIVKIVMIYGLKIDSNHIKNMPIARLFFMLSVYLLFAIIYFFIKKFNYNINLMQIINKKHKIILNTIFSLGIISIISQSYLLAYYRDALPRGIGIAGIAASIAYFLISFYSYNKVSDLEDTTKKLEQSRLYNKTLGILHDNIRGFKHDFNNIVQALGGYIVSEDKTGLKKYYYQLLEDCQRINSMELLNPEIINNPAIYSLLTAKYFLAEEKNIKMLIEVYIDLNELKIDTYKFSRIFGILLDNAIEANKDCEIKEINIIMKKDVKKQLVIIENTYTNKDIDTEKIFEKGCSTKENNTGLGLWEIREILKRSNNLNLHTSKDDKYFKQQLEIFI